MRTISDHALSELERIASFTEPHWRGAGLPLESEWIIERWRGHTTECEREIDELETRLDSALSLIREANDIVLDGSGPMSPRWTNWQKRVFDVCDRYEENQKPMTDWRGCEACHTPPNWPHEDDCPKAAANGTKPLDAAE